MVKLTNVQREVLEALVKLYEEKRRMVKSCEVAQYLGKDKGTVRNIIMWLKNMGLVNSRTGPAGGYAPTLKAYEIIKGYPGGLSMSYGRLKVRDEKGGEEEYNIVGMEIIGLFTPEKAKAIIHLASGAEGIRPGMRVRVESAPGGRAVVEGVVEKVEPGRSEILLVIDKFVVMPDARVGTIASRKLITIKEDMKVRDAARILHAHAIRGAPVVNEKGEIVGFITTTDIAALVAYNKDLDSPVSKYMRRNVFTITENESIVEAMKLMDYYNVGRLLVLGSDGKPVGIVTRTDILRYIAALE